SRRLSTALARRWPLGGIARESQWFRTPCKYIGHRVVRVHRRSPFGFRMRRAASLFQDFVNARFDILRRAGWTQSVLLYVVLPNVLFALLGQFVFTTRPLFNIDYLLLGSV